MENSIKEALEKLSTGKKIKMYELLRTFKKEGIENFVITRKKYVDVILSDYKRVLKENEELKQDRNNNYQMIALSQNEMLGYIQGYEDGKKLRKNAVANIVENQQYYILNKQIEKYKECIEKLQKDNEELKEWQETYKSEKKMKNEYVKLYQDLLLKENVIPVQKVKDKIEHYQKLQDNYIEKYDEINEVLQAMINALKELLEGRK